jgi:peroxiredoxin
VGVQYGAAESKEQATARRVAYLIGPDGNVKHVWPKATPASFAEEVLAQL